MRRHQTALFAFLRQVTLDPERAEDLVQETFLRAFQNLDKFDGARYSSLRSFSTWLFTIARRIYINSMRTKEGQPISVDVFSLQEKELEDDSDSLNSIPGRDPDAAALAARQEQDQRLWSWVRERLTEDQWSVLWLRYTEDYSIPQIAQILDKSPGSVKSLLLRGKEALTRSAIRQNLSWEFFVGQE